MKTMLITFTTMQEARDYRHANGTGGWIFAGHELVVLFPPDVSPTGIFNHPLTRGHWGVLT
ncbi:MAG: hypothetical protein WCK89_20050 [bacterium]